MSNIRQVPDHHVYVLLCIIFIKYRSLQESLIYLLVSHEVFVNASRDESLIFELLDFKTEVGNNGSASWFLYDLARDQDVDRFKVTTRFSFCLSKTNRFSLRKLQLFWDPRFRNCCYFSRVKANSWDFKIIRLPNV